MAWEQVETLVAIPTKGNVNIKFALSLVNLPLRNFVISTAENYPIDLSRNLLVAQALSLSSRYIFFLDDDIIASRKQITKLYNEVEKYDIISAIYLHKILAKPVARINGEYIRENNGIIAVDDIGFGCCFIKTSIFERIAKSNTHTFKCLTIHNDKESTIGQRNNKTISFDYETARSLRYRCDVCNGYLVYPFFRWTHGFEIDGTSEDYDFCKTLRRNNISIFVDSDVIVKHLFPALIHEEGVSPVYGVAIE
ncbi:MAG: hypothetical protein QXO37_06935 [Candidatus Nitrosocaldaceae archaeon]